VSQEPYVEAAAGLAVTRLIPRKAAAATKPVTTLRVNLLDAPLASAPADLPV
jgi:hypothetical protein